MNSLRGLILFFFCFCSPILFGQGANNQPAALNSQQLTSANSFSSPSQLKMKRGSEDAIKIPQCHRTSKIFKVQKRHQFKKKEFWFFFYFGIGMIIASLFLLLLFATIGWWAFLVAFGGMFLGFLISVAGIPKRRGWAGRLGTAIVASVSISVFLVCFGVLSLIAGILGLVALFS